MHSVGELDLFAHFDGAQGEKNSNLPVVPVTLSLHGLESMYNKGPRTDLWGVCGVPGQAVHGAQLGEGSSHSHDGSWPIKKRSLSGSPSLGIPQSKLC